MPWLIREEIAQRLREAHRSIRPSADQLGAFEARVESARSSGPRSLALAGDVAEIRVLGVLTQKPDFWSWILGLDNTTYGDIQEALALARSDAGVKSVRLFVDSPGGEVDGLFDLFATLEDFRGTKPLAVRAVNAHSAAYGIAAMAGPIEAANAASMFGSVGVAARYVQRADIEVHDITNTDSPDKRPDPATPEGQAVIVRELDAIFDLFADAIARGRGMTKKAVVEGFGRGASFVAGDAKERKMIDTIARPALRAVSPETASAVDKTIASAAGGGRRKAEKMNLEELRSQHPDAHAAAVQAGVTQERDRVVAHLTMGETSGDMKTASEAIRSGDGMTQTMTARYLAAGMNRADRSARQTETDAAGKAADGAVAAAPSADQDAFGNQVVEALTKRAGVTRG